MLYNNLLGRPEKKHIISRDRAYHGSTYLTASISGKDREKIVLILKKIYSSLRLS